MGKAARPAPGGAFDEMLRSTSEDGPATEEQSETGAPPLAGLFGVPIVNLPAPVVGAPEAPSATQASHGGVLTPVGDVAEADGGAAAEGAKALRANAPVASLAAALQAQADGFASARTARPQGQTPEAAALAAAGVASLKGETLATVGSVKTAVPAEGAAPAAAPVQLPTAVAKGKPSGDAAKVGAKDQVNAPDKSGGVDQAAAQAAAKADADAEIVGATDAKPQDGARGAGQTDRVPPMQATTAAPTASAPQGGQATGANLAASAQIAAAVQVAEKIADHASSKRTRFEVRLDPGDLGRVDVRLEFGHDGRVATRLIVERPETLDMLRNDARELSRTLEQAGFQLGQGGLAFQLKDGRQQQWDFEAAQSGGVSDEVEIDAMAPAAAAAYARAPSGAGVDMKV